MPPKISVYEARGALGLLLSLTRPDGPLARIAQLHEDQTTDDRPLVDFLHYFQSEIFQVYTLLPGLRSRLAAHGLPACVSCLLDHLEGLVVASTCPTGSFTKLWTLVKRYGDAQANSINDGNLITFINFGNDALQTSLLDALGNCVDELSEYTDGKDLDTTDNKTLKRSEPNYAAWKLNTLLFDTFWATTSHCIGCKAPTTTMALFTHRKALETLDIEAILSLNDPSAFAQEVRFRICSTDPPITAARKTKVAFIDTPAPKKNRRKAVRQKILHICEPLYSARAAQVQLHFVAEDHAIWLDNRSQAYHSADELKNVITLAELSSEHSGSMTDQTKLIIAVILGHTLLHLWDTPLLCEWSRERIIFIRSMNTVPLKPYLLSQRKSNSSDMDDFLRLHPYPDILGLGIMLLELDLQQSVESYLQPKDELNVNSAWINAQAAFKRHQGNMYKNYRMAIKACLDNNFADDIDPDEDPEEFRRQIYFQIVKPLEDELEAGFSDLIDVNDIDTEAGKLDVLKFGQPIPQKSSGHSLHNFPQERSQSRPANESRYTVLQYSVEDVTPEEAEDLYPVYPVPQYTDV
ncbi:hypothetical protein B0J11DRAFT_580240 [Dendryphion nanum]|uniref:DUF7580 domain-containing protein n=1 Tax=Dendryphion nanum TaxID=256645 RepID=A0A9P9DUW6_9PLEO|nr:hypothetical protein B0J11DRAFT_580240 [Dendryphion nanum]